MDWVGKAWQYGDQCKAIVGIEIREDNDLN